jgi:hypothetical protein
MRYFPFLMFASTLIFGCSGRPSRVAAPTVNAADAAQSAMELYDRNTDGILDSEELLASPPLVNAMSAYDTDHNGALSKAELVSGIESWSRRGVGATAVPFSVRLDGKPLKGAEIKLTPAPFLNGAVAPAAGTSDESGAGSLQITGDRPANVPANLPLIQPGLYLVEITHPTISIPDAYNKASTLGLEAGVAGQNPAGVVWELSSKKK